MSASEYAALSTTKPKHVRRKYNKKKARVVEQARR
jgi:hypothetical protein